ncbi:ZNF57-like protein [Mya arenaria]|uniref:ZNF57-like protein n=1 Tax=Mya arenaria TaxID=6604 RepID=A0ABY7FB18_MYAAR|nr:ZNF57-like protein [Mya arenaria]
MKALIQASILYVLSLASNLCLRLENSSFRSFCSFPLNLRVGCCVSSTGRGVSVLGVLSVVCLSCPATPAQGIQVTVILSELNAVPMSCANETLSILHGDSTSGYEKYNALMEIKEPGSFQYSNGFKFSINDTIKPEWTGDGNEVELSREIKVEPHSHYDSELTSDYAEEVEEIIKLQKKKRKKKTRINDKDTHLKKIKYEAYSDFDLLKHKQACSPDNSKLYVCDICGAQYPRRDMYRAHMGKEHGLNHWKCRYCEENFPTRFAYQVHMRHKHSEQLKFCTKCKQYMASLSNEDYHAHCDACTGEFQCPECGKMFQGKMVLATHVRYIHKNIRNHQCHLCSYSAKSANMLRLHLNAHQGEKPYKCDQCNYAAAWNVQLKEHVKAHSLSTAVTCQQCRVMFKNQHTLAIHEKKEHARGAGMAGAEMIGAMVMGAGLTQGQVVPAAAIQQWTLNSSTQ